MNASTKLYGITIVTLLIAGCATASKPVAISPRCAAVGNIAARAAENAHRGVSMASSIEQLGEANVVRAVYSERNWTDASTNGGALDRLAKRMERGCEQNG